MSSLYLTRTQILALSAVIIAAGAGVGTWSYRWEQAHLTRDLIHDAATGALAFEDAELRTLSGQPGDAGRPSFAVAAHRLQRLQAVNPRLRSAYLLRVQGDPPAVALLADANARSPADESHAATIFAEPDRAAFFARLARQGLPAVVHAGSGPGGRVTGFARIDGAPGTDDAAADVLAVAVSEADWQHDLWSAALRGALYTWGLLALPLLGWIVRRREGEQREAIRNLSEAVEQSRSAIMILDLEHRIEYANRGLCQQLGYGRRELLGRRWRDLLTAITTEPTGSDLEVTMRSGRSWEGEWTNRRKDGTTYPVRGMVTPVRHRDGSMACFVVTFDDVTEAKRKEAELREARDLAQAADRAKGHFLATMSHEVRTPLNGIVGFTSLLLDTPLSVEQREYVQTIRASGEALIQLTGDILDFARIESGKLKLDPVACDPRECLEEALDLHAAKAAEKGIELLHRAARDIPVSVVVDAGRLRQVLVNLVGNAVKFTERGEVEASIRRLPDDVASADGAAAGCERGADGTPRPPPQTSDDAPTCVLEFRIRDTGVGIARDDHGRLFKPFSQLDASSTRRYGGVGLGLAISRNLVHLMGGEIAVVSEEGRGSTFVFTVRVAIATPEGPERQLDGLRVALAAQPGAFRTELAEVLASWGADVCLLDAGATPDPDACDIGILEVSTAMAEALVQGNHPRSGLPPEKLLAIVPISLPSQFRSALRSHFRYMVNRPVHHAPLYALLSGSRPAGTALSGTTGRKYGFNVLIVEDNAVNQRLAARVLLSMGCSSTAVTNGREALEELRRNPSVYDIILLDLHMPEMDGLSALERIRRGEVGPQPQSAWIVALTADARPEQRARGFATGLNDYLTKPLRFAELDAAFRRYEAQRSMKG